MFLLLMCFAELVEEKQLWRAITAVYTHANLLHLVFNMMSLWNLNFVETTGGSVTYFKYTYFLVVLDELLITSFNWVMVHQFEQDRYRTQAAVGYSGVVFGLMSIVSAAGPLQLISFMGLFSVYSILYPFCSLFLIQLLVPQASFIGHLAGILVGFLIGFGMLSWVNDFLFWCLFFWTVVVLVFNVKQYSRIPLPCIQVFPSASNSPRQTRTSAIRTVLRNGNLVRVQDDEGGEEADDEKESDLMLSSRV
eukprot:TRINITY_DN4961_c0_g1_i8.p1 TRINITY_DN4961_c0_g1~~TRINITY_DN4961_c0_g1_i8.p1  ORF type:complete len:250 (+),score=49.35 TRINITY_DN4961_c0_g1_i8:755-1504(+)